METVATAASRHSLKPAPRRRTSTAKAGGPHTLVGPQRARPPYRRATAERRRRSDEARRRPPSIIMWPQRLPEVHDDDELVLVTEKPLCLQGLRTGLHERIQRYGGLVILRKVVQFTHLTSGTGQGVEESAFAFYGPSFPSDRYPNNNWGHFEGTNGSSTYNCRGPTTAYMVVGPTGLLRGARPGRLAEDGRAYMGTREGRLEGYW